MAKRRPDTHLAWQGMLENFAEKQGIGPGVTPASARWRLPFLKRSRRLMSTPPKDIRHSAIVPVERGKRGRGREAGRQAW